jgi:hypothetical protein
MFDQDNVPELRADVRNPRLFLSNQEQGYVGVNRVMSYPIARHWIVLIVALLVVVVSRSEWTNEQTMTSSEPKAGGFYGRAVHTFGDFVIVGDNSTASIYIMPDTDWVEQARFSMPAMESSLGSYGASVGLEASIAVVGAPHLSVMGQTLSSTDPRFNQSASAFAYGRELNTWSLQAKFTSLQSGTDGFGYSVAIGGSYLVIGAPYAYDLKKGDGAGFGITAYDGQGPTSPPTSAESPSSSSIITASSTPQRRMGAAYTYKRVNATWVATGVLVPFASDENDLFGWSVDISSDGTKLVIGSPGDTIDGTDSGSAYVYSIDATGTWNLDGRLTGSDEDDFDSFGYSVAIDVSDVVVGTKTARAAYIFHKMAEAWIQDAKLVGSDTTVDDGFGQSVSIFGTYAVVGAPTNMGRGAVYLWELDMDLGSWVQFRKLTGSMLNSRMGSCVALGSRFTLAGAPGANHDIGHVLSLMLDGSVVGNPIVDSIEDTVVLIRFSGDSTYIDLLTTRKILADAAGTGTAQTEVRIVDIASNSGPVASHLFGLQVRYTTSPTMFAGTAAQNLLAALPDIRYRLNAAVGAISGTAELIPTNPPTETSGKTLTIQQVAALIILILSVIFTVALLVYFTAERRKKIAADKLEFDALEAEREAKREREKKEKTEKKSRYKRPQNVLRQQKRKTGVYMQAENDAAGLSFSETFLDPEEFPLSPRGGPDIAGDFDPTEYDPTASLDVVSPTKDYTGTMDGTVDTMDDGPSISLDDGPRIQLDLDDGPRLRDYDDGPRIRLEEDDGPRIPLDLEDNGPRIGLGGIDGPSLRLTDDGPRITMDDGPRIPLDDGPRILMGYGPVTPKGDGPTVRTIPDDGPSLRFSDALPDDGPSLKLSDDGPSISMGGSVEASPHKIPDDDGPMLRISDGPTISMDATEPSPRKIPNDDDPSLVGHGPSLRLSGEIQRDVPSPATDHHQAPAYDLNPEDLEDPTAEIPVLRLPSSSGHDSGNDSDSGSISTPGGTKHKRPANVPKLNIPGF